MVNKSKIIDAINNCTMGRLRNVCNSRNNYVNSPHRTTSECDAFKMMRSNIRSTSFAVPDKVLCQLFINDKGKMLAYRRIYDYSNGFTKPSQFLLAQSDALLKVVSHLCKIGKIDFNVMIDDYIVELQKIKIQYKIK